MTVPRRVGILGGTFDPPHVGHLVAAANVAHVLSLDRVLFTVANVPWQKVGTRAISAPEHRLAMTTLATESREIFVTSDIEVQRGGETVTADTLSELRDEWPGTELTVILGSDAAGGLMTWRRPAVVKELATIAVVDRPGADGERPPPDFRSVVVPCPLMDISSTEIRRRVRAAQPIDFLVTDAIASYIDANRLYGSAQETV